MNFLRFNGGTLNGARVVAALALVSCTATASVSPQATHTNQLKAASVGTATIAGDATRKQFANAPALGGDGTLTASVQQAHHIAASVVGKASFIGYSLRYIYGAGDLTGSGEFVAVPASTLGRAAFVGTCSLSGLATPVRFGKIQVAASAEVANTIESIVNRTVRAEIIGTSAWYIESGINGVYEAHARPVGSAQTLVQESGLVRKFGGSQITAEALCSVLPTHHLRSHSSVLVVGGIASTDPAIYYSGHGVPVGTAHLVAEVTYHRMAGGTMDATCAMEINPSGLYQCHAANGTVVASSSMQADLTHIHMVCAEELSGASTVQANITYVFRVSAGVLGAASIMPTPIQDHAAQLNLLGLVDMTANGIIPIPIHAYAALDSTCEITATPIHTMKLVCFIEASGELLPIGYENLMKVVSPERTFIRPKTVRLFIRPGSKPFERN